MVVNKKASSLPVRLLRILFSDHELRNSLLTNLLVILRLAVRRKIATGYNRIIVINLVEHIGDIVAAEPIAYHLRKNNPNAYIIWTLKKDYAALVENNPNVNRVLSLTSVTEWILLKKLISPYTQIYDLHINGKRCLRHKLVSRNPVKTGIDLGNYLHHGTLLQVFAQVAGILAIPDYAPRFHFDPSVKSPDLPQPYVVIQTLSNDPLRNWSEEKWNQLVQSLLEGNPSLNIIEVGLTNVITSDSVRYHNLTRKLSLQQIARVIDNSQLFIGIESGFGHFANALRKPCIILKGEFHQFGNYEVYSGDFAKSVAMTVVYHQAPLQTLTTERVLEAVLEKLRTLNPAAYGQHSH